MLHTYLRVTTVDSKIEEQEYKSRYVHMYC